MNKDEDHLNSLSIAHYAVGGLMVLFACFPLFHMGIGLFFIFGDASMFAEKGGEAPPEFIGWMFFIMGLMFFLIGQAISICIIISGRYLKKRKKYYYSFVLACISCLFVPFGTILGVFTIVVLCRDSVKEIYGV